MCACALSRTYTHTTRYMIPTHANRNKHTLTRPKLPSYTNLQPRCPAPMCPAPNVLAQRAEGRRLLETHNLPSGGTAQQDCMAACAKPRTLLASCSTPSKASTALLTAFRAKDGHECQNDG